MVAVADWEANPPLLTVRVILPKDCVDDGLMMERVRDNKLEDIPGIRVIVC